MTAALLLVLMGATAAPPTYLVERVVTLGSTSTRLSVFRNGVAVLVRSATGENGSLVRQPLSEVELLVLTQVVEECYPELVRFGELGKGPGEGRVELRLAPPGRDPLLIRFALTAAPTLATSRITQALDGVEARMERTNVSREDLHDWQPSVGDRVELEDGRVVEVKDVLLGPEGMVVHAQVGEGPVSIFLSADDLRRLALRRVAK
ncbi:MAG: hypothetical protein LAO05_11810 [Acidobacteriia bacterium]|nr:hypothetical protein [Terriglobia bacterium]